MPADGDQCDLGGGEEAAHHDEDEDDREVEEGVTGRAAGTAAFRHRAVRAASRLLVPIRGRRVASRLAGSLRLAAPRPAQLDGPGRHADHRLARGDVAGHDRSRAGPRPGANGDRGAKHGVHADEGAIADGRRVLALAVEVGGDRAGTDVDVVAELRVTQVAHVVLLGAGTHPRLLELRIVSDPAARSRSRSRDAGGCTDRSAHPRRPSTPRRRWPRPGSAARCGCRAPWRRGR